MVRRAVSVADAADMWGVSEEFIRRKIRRGELPALRVGRGPRAAYRIPVDALDRVLEAA